MIYFDSNMSKCTNTVAYFDWKTVIYIYVCEKCHTQFMLPMEKSVTFTGACANEIIPSINRSLSTKRKKVAMLEFNRNVQKFTNVYFELINRFVLNFPNTSLLCISIHMSIFALLLLNGEKSWS